MTINIERFKQVRAAVAANPDFDMATYVHECGTAACILGSAALIAFPDDEVRSKWKDTDVWSTAHWLGLTAGQNTFRGVSELINYLQYGDWSENGTKATKEEALIYLDKVIETGDVFQTVSLYELEGA